MSIGSALRANSDGPVRPQHSNYTGSSAKKGRRIRLTCSCSRCRLLGLVSIQVWSTMSETLTLRMLSEMMPPISAAIVKTCSSRNWVAAELGTRTGSGVSATHQLQHASSPFVLRAHPSQQTYCSSQSQKRRNALQSLLHHYELSDPVKSLI